MRARPAVVTSFFSLEATSLALLVLEVVPVAAPEIVEDEEAVRRLAPVRLRQLLGVVLVIAAIKMFITA